MTPIHYSQIDKATWPWPHFSPEEMRCRRTGLVMVSPVLMERLEHLREANGGTPLVVTSAYRSIEHNKEVGGAPNSLHLKGEAVDILTTNVDPNKLILAARASGFNGIIKYPSRGFIHFDIRSTPFESGDDFPARVDRFDDNTPPPIRIPSSPVDAAKVAGVAAFLKWAADSGLWSVTEIDTIKTILGNIGQMLPMVEQIIRGAQHPLGAAFTVAALVYAWHRRFLKLPKWGGQDE